MNIPEGTVLAHARRQGGPTGSDSNAAVIRCNRISESVPQSLAAIFNERKERTKLGLSNFTAEAAEEAAEHRNKLGIVGDVRYVSAVHSTLCPANGQDSNPENHRDTRMIETESSATLAIL